MPLTSTFGLSSTNNSWTRGLGHPKIGPNVVQEVQNATPQFHPRDTGNTTTGTSVHSEPTRVGDPNLRTNQHPSDPKKLIVFPKLVKTTNCQDPVPLGRCKHLNPAKHERILSRSLLQYLFHLDPRRSRSGPGVVGWWSLSTCHRSPGPVFTGTAVSRVW